MPSRTSTPCLARIVEKYRMVSLNSSLPGMRRAMSNCPPIKSLASNSVTR
ncbi:Uncharacterised protein [Mycobacterium tuberculosis]|uniref:Uncharacterized protein n=1 Tax=Mycobacterium tuberculosis TaxID=1773 RepID=A0A916L9X1_MYCTX|nr:Uncharacterised protein [Mycobacterium tuberculosis]